MLNARAPVQTAHACALSVHPGVTVELNFSPPHGERLVFISLLTTANSVDHELLHRQLTHRG